MWGCIQAIDISINLNPNNKTPRCWGLCWGKGKIIFPMSYYASKILNVAQVNYIITEFRQIHWPDNPEILIFQKEMQKLGWTVLLQEFNLEIIDDNDRRFRMRWLTTCLGLWLITFQILSPINASFQYESLMLLSKLP